MDNTSFNANNLQVMIQFNGNTAMWSPQPTFNRTLDGNLLGTLRVSDHVLNIEREVVYNTIITRV